MNQVSITSLPKIPRFDFVKFPQADDSLTTQMKSVGEAMAIGRTFQESLQKAMRSLEIGSYGFETKLADLHDDDRRLKLENELRTPKAGPFVVHRRCLSRWLFDTRRS